MSLIMKSLNLCIVGIFMGNEKSSTDGTGIGISTIGKENLGVVFVVVNIYGSVKSHDNHLWSL